MNENEGRSLPTEPGRARQKPAEPMPAEVRENDTTSAGSGAGADATQRIGSDVEPDATESTPKAKGAVLQPATKPLAPKDGEVIANRFIVRRMLGQGGMGRVYAVQDKQIEGRDVALKVLLPKFSKSAQFRKLF